MPHAELADEAKSVFLARMSHELRTPLNSVIGFANIVRRTPREALLPAELVYLDRVVANGRHLLRTINSILDASKIEAKQETVELEPVALAALAGDVLRSLETRLRSTASACGSRHPPRSTPALPTGTSCGGCR
jgi:signal transduction histidine kinase